MNILPGRLVKDVRTGRVGVVQLDQGRSVLMTCPGTSLPPWSCPKDHLLLSAPEDRAALGLDPYGDRP
ncbi:hypothetical protein I5Q34_04360 [Streptomyces sp. AV19]|uniref:hypothetical protein n=1 Tax=Streptomyces sp. AV19 TaxID=2793068 RepID=UPI0018FE6D48|nr:hypothetical protein [Streptomyces sp. AV19]MBH1933529.1 hypothetical protein [Streptomyces sp. AV19]MDG4532183.1 hypothetical protein [Streptomyces sp. AV19]